ncbi:MAG: hypothetical protein IJ512_04700 [Ruminococcus sp.]|nr:hypothetical protein [Ruminococcus sp.]
MKKFASICMVSLMALSALVGCSADDTANSENASGAPTGKVVVNFEGTVTAINGDEITLENGKIVVISSDTVFAGDPDTNNAVSEEIAIGNFIQGYTEDDPDSEQVSADKIYCNMAVRTGGKLVINFEGRVSAIENDRITLENGQVILVSDDTVFSIASGVVENVILSEGYSIQGYTEGDPAASEVTASRIHIIAY